MTSRRTVRGEGDPITTCEPLTLGESEYLAETNEVRHVVARNEEGPVEWTTEPFTRHANRECVKVASEAVGSTIEERLELPVEHVSTGARFDAEDDTEADVLVTYRVWMETWEDAVNSRPIVDFDELVAATPSTVKATVEVGDGEYAVQGQEYSCEVPVFVRKTEAALL